MQLTWSGVKRLKVLNKSRLVSTVALREQLFLSETWKLFLLCCGMVDAGVFSRLRAGAPSFDDTARHILDLSLLFIVELFFCRCIVCMFVSQLVIV